MFFVDAICIPYILCSCALHPLHLYLKISDFENPEYDNKCFLKHLKHFLIKFNERPILTKYGACSVFKVNLTLAQWFWRFSKVVNVFFAIMPSFPIQEGSDLTLTRTNWNSFLPKYMSKRLCRRKFSMVVYFIISLLSPFPYP